MTRPSISVWLVAVAALLLIAAGSLVLLDRVTERTEVRNLSGQTITNVVLELRDFRGDWLITKRVASLQPGGSLRVRHSHRDSKAVVTFAIADRTFRHEEPYIDLWTGEGWRFDVHADGTVARGYDYHDAR
jgi:hypothetical protein